MASGNNQLIKHSADSHISSRINVLNIEFRPHFLNLGYIAIALDVLRKPVPVDSPLDVVAKYWARGVPEE